MEGGGGRSLYLDCDNAMPLPMVYPILGLPLLTYKVAHF